MKGQGGGARDEEVEVFGGADRLRAEAGGGRHERRRGVPKGRVSEVTFYARRKKYAGRMPSEMRRLR